MYLTVGACEYMSFSFVVCVYLCIHYIHIFRKYPRTEWKETWGSCVSVIQGMYVYVDIMDT